MPRKQVEEMRAAGWISASDAATLAGVTIYSIYRWINQGKVDGKKLGDFWYISEESLKNRLGDGLDVLLAARAEAAAQEG